MIDFHTHILPNIDDGSRNMEETLELIKEAKKAGFNEIIFTPHYIENYYETSVSEREKLLNTIKKRVKKEGIDVELYLANEIYLSENIVSLLKENKALSLNNSRYILFEMPLNSKPMNLYDMIYLIEENKYIPVLAHPERYSFIQKDPNIIYDLIEKGCLMQSNYGSILGQYGKKAKFLVRKLLKNNMVYFLGSDVHRRKSIYLKIPETLQEIENIIGTDNLERITKVNPKLALSDKKIEIYDPIKIKFSLKEKLFMNI